MQGKIKQEEKNDNTGYILLHIVAIINIFFFIFQVFSVMHLGKNDVSKQDDLTIWAAQVVQPLVPFAMSVFILVHYVVEKEQACFKKRNGKKGMSNILLAFLHGTSIFQIWLVALEVLACLVFYLSQKTSPQTHSKMVYTSVAKLIKFMYSYYVLYNIWPGVLLAGVYYKYFHWVDVSTIWSIETIYKKH